MNISEAALGLQSLLASMVLMQELDFEKFEAFFSQKSAIFIKPPFLRVPLHLHCSPRSWVKRKINRMLGYILVWPEIACEYAKIL